ncbi:hypothetical protein [Rathayibacter soli]|uniref:hypothetical protein n=1 Tax=Rathayibacter soli TaxID=3144168 RepID=UPI0027E431FD|nr:hypothetical protein [Glaciibacter superstes]
MATLIAALAILIVATPPAWASGERALVAALAGFGSGGLLFARTAAPRLWMVLLGGGQRGIFPLVLTLFVLSATDCYAVISQS